MKTSHAVLCLALGETILWAGLYYIFPALLLRWELAEGWSKITLTAAFTGAVIMSAIFSPVVGRLIDKGRGPEIMAGSALFGSSLVALLPLANSIWLFAGIWLLIGVAMGGCLYEPCFALITRTRGLEARRAITLVTLFAGFASTLSFPLNHRIAELFGWEAAALTLAGIMAACAVPLIWLGAKHLEAEWQTRQVPVSEQAEDVVLTSNDLQAQHTSDNYHQHSVTNVLHYPVFWLLVAGFSLLAVNHGVVLNHFLPILQDRGIHPDLAVFAASMIGPMQVVGRLMVMATERHVSSHVITIGCFVAVTLATVSLFTATVSPILIAPFVILQGSGYGVISIMKPVVTREVLGGEDFGTISGLIAVPYLIAYALAPFLGSLLWEVGGYQLVLVTIGIFGLLGLCCYQASVQKAK